MFRYKYLVRLIIWEYVIAAIIILFAYNFKFIKDIERLENVIAQQEYKYNILKTVANSKIQEILEENKKEIQSGDTETEIENTTYINNKPSSSKKLNQGVFKITAYCSCEKCCGVWAVKNGGGITASGTRVQEGRTIAVYRKQIPFGTEVHIKGLGTYIAEDTGSAIKENCIDVYFDSHEEAKQFGVKRMAVEW